MVIEIDRKKVAKAKRDMWIMSLLTPMTFLLYGSTIFDQVRDGDLTWTIISNILMILVCLASIIVLCRRFVVDCVIIEQNTICLRMKRG